MLEGGDSRSSSFGEVDWSRKLPNGSSRPNLPQLTQDDSTMDWPGAWLESRVETMSGTAMVRISMAGAYGLDELIASGDARWAVELRCPSTQLARIVKSSNTEFRAEWNASEIDGDLFLLPGLVAVRDTILNPEGMDPLWGLASIPVPVGTWLARGRVHRARSLSQSLLSINLDENLRAGRMRVTPLLADGNLRFLVDLAPDLHQRRTHRDVQIAALIAAFGHIPLFLREREDDEGVPMVLRELKERLRAEGVKAWDEENFDPALAATAIEEFRLAHCPEGEA